MLRPMRMTRYVLAELLTPTLLGLMFYSFFLLMNNFFLVAEKALSKNLSLELTTRLFLTFLPTVLVLAIPMSVLLGSLVAVGRLSADHEWVALQGAGRGPWVLLKPLLIHGLVASAVSLFVYAELVPRSNYTRRHLNGQILLSSSLASDLKPRVFYTQLHNFVLYVDDIQAGAAPSEDEGRLKGLVLIQTEPRQNNFQVILARSGELYPAADRSGTLIADLYHGGGVRYTPDAPETYYRLEFESHREPIPPPPYLEEFLAPPDKVVSDMTTAELLGELRDASREQAATVARLTAEGRDPSDRQERFLVDNRVRVSMVEASARFALPLASLFFVALALPLGITRARSGKGAGFALSLIVILVYWGTYTFFRDQSVTGGLPAWLGPWIANMILVPWAAVALWRLRRPRDGSSGPLAVIATGFIRLSRALRRMGAIRRAEIDAEVQAESEAGDEVPALDRFGGTPNRFVDLLDQYIVGHYLRVLFFALASAYLIAMLVRFRGLVDDLLRTEQSYVLLLEYFKYFAPTLLNIVLPISCLIAAIVCFTLLARTGELTAIKASGTSMRRATLPIIGVTILLCILLFWVENTVAPAANRRTQEIEDQIMGRAPKTYGLSSGGRWGFGGDGQTLYHYQLFDPEQREFQGLTVLGIDRSGPRILHHRFAQRASWTGGTGHLENGWERSFDEEGNPTAYEVWEGTRDVQLEPPAQLTVKQVALAQGGISEQMSFDELKREIEVLRERGYDTTRLEVAFHGKIARSAAPLVMVLLGLPFSFRVGRRGSLYGIGVALLLVLVYWAVFAVFNALGLETLLEPWAAAWAPNVLFGLFGTYLLLYVPT